MTGTGRNVAPPLARGLNRVEAARYIGVSPTTFDNLVTENKMPKPKKIGTRRIWDVSRLDLAFDAIAGDDAAVNPWDEL